MSKKWSKFLLALAGIGAAIGIGIAFFKKKQHTLDDNSEFSDDFEDEDFDLDSDLEPVTQRILCFAQSGDRGDTRRGRNLI